jgi:pimeloyl-ACP methyl ester carboxylesterase
MHRIVAAVVLLGSAAPSLAGEAPLHTIGILSGGIRADERQCKANSTALWLRVDGRNACIRYWIAGPASRPGQEALVLLHGDIGRRVKGRYFLADDAGDFSASDVQDEARAVARIYPGHAIVVGRPGSYGSSGNHLADRRTLREVRAIAVALDGLKARHGIKRFHFAGHSGGGHTVAALAQTRDDIGCVVITSGAVSVMAMHRDRGLPLDRSVRHPEVLGAERAEPRRTHDRALGRSPPPLYDPIDHVARMAARPGLRLIVVSDPDDKIVSFRSQREFVDRVKARNLPVVHITAAAIDKASHNLHAHGIRLAADCAKGMSDQALVARYRTKPLASRAQRSAKRCAADPGSSKTRTCRNRSAPRL